MEKIVITVCGGSGCKSQESKLIFDKLSEIVWNEHLPIKINRTGCQGFCEMGPIVTVHPQNIFYSKVKVADSQEIIEAAKNNTIVDRLLFIEHETDGDHKRTHTEDIDFYKYQTRLVLDRCGNIDPYSFDEYSKWKGYQGLKKALDLEPNQVVEVIKDSGLRGRGGAGFTTGLKWGFLAAANSQEKFIVCNADEGDPGSFMDRTMMEGDPYAIIEGMTIAGYATGATQGFIYCRAEYPESIELLTNAINQAKERNCLGENILGKGFSFDIELKLGAGAFVCGEETALIKSIEGNRGMPVSKPPFPAEKGLWGKPTNINNVKTYAYATHILTNGADWFKQYGTEKSPGTAVLALTGKVNNTGIIEVPMGTTLRDVIYKIGGGIKGDKKFKAVLTGGPSGGCLPESCLDLGIDYESITKAGSIMGSGGMLVLDESDSMIDVADFFLEFTVAESCGKCTPCREGLKRMKAILEKIKSGKGTNDDIVMLEHLSSVITDSASCGLGQTAPNPVLTTLRYFREEYEELIKPEFKYYHITNKCVGCGICRNACPIQCISGEFKTKHKIDDSKCIGCGKCYNNCPAKAIIFDEEHLKADKKPVFEVRE